MSPFRFNGTTNKVACKTNIQNCLPVATPHGTHGIPDASEENDYTVLHYHRLKNSNLQKYVSEAMEQIYETCFILNVSIDLYHHWFLINV